MRLIDADALWDELTEDLEDGDVLYRIPPSYIDDAPTIDAVPVVRCKGCGHAERYERTDGTAGYYCGHPQSTFVYGERWDRVFKPVKKLDDFRIYRRPHLLQLRRTSHQPICGRAQYGTICRGRQNRRPK